MEVIKLNTRKRMEELLPFARIIAKGSSDFRNMGKATFYQNSDDKDKIPSQTYFSFTFENIELNHPSNSGLSITVKSENDIIPVVDLEEWFDRLEKEMNNNGGLYRLIKIKGKQYIEVVEVKVEDDFPF